VLSKCIHSTAAPSVDFIHTHIPSPNSHGLYALSPWKIYSPVAVGEFISFGQKMKPTADISFLWPQVSTKADDGVISTKTSGCEGDCHWTGERQFAPGGDFYEAWDWVYRNRHAFPPSIR